MSLNNPKIKHQQILEKPIKKEITYIKNYKIIKRIGFGASGLVYKVTKANDPTDQIYILKQVLFSDNNLEETNKKAKEGKNEAIILSKLSCKFIVKYYESFIDEDYNLNIIMEYCDSGDLNAYIESKKKQKKLLSENEIWYFFIQISLGLAYIHSKNILHRDLKPMNIFLTNKNHVKIGDLGVAKILRTNSNAHSCIGTPYYLSPEVCQEKPYNSKSDVWSLGCILYELCTFNKPFFASNPAALILKIINGNYVPLNQVNNGMNYSKELQEILDTILQKDYMKRPLMKEIINSNIFKNKVIEFGFLNDLVKINSIYQNENQTNEIRDNEIKINILLNKNLNVEYNNNIGKKTNFAEKNNGLLNIKNYDKFLNTNKSSKNDIQLQKNNGKKFCNKNKYNYITSSNRYNKNLVSTGRSTIDSSYNNEKGNNMYASTTESNLKYINNTNMMKNKLSLEKNNSVKFNINKKTYKENNEPKQKSLNSNIKTSSKNSNKKITIQKNFFDKKYNNCLNKFKNHISPCQKQKNIYNFQNMYTLNANLNISSINSNKRSGSKHSYNKNERNKHIMNTDMNNSKASCKNSNNEYYEGYNTYKNSTYVNSYKMNPQLNNNKTLISDKQSINIIKQNNDNNSFSENMRNQHNISYDNKKKKFYTTDRNNIFLNKNKLNKLNLLNNENNSNKIKDDKFEIEDSNKKEVTDSSSDENCINNEIIEDSGLEDEDDEEKVSIVKENNNNVNIIEKIKIQKEEYIKKYNEYKNKIFQYKNIIDIYKLFSLYEMLNKDKTKTEEIMKEIETYMRNNLNKDTFRKFHKLFSNYIYYDVKIENINHIQEKYC